jgi:hypothetical protein
MKIQSYMGEHSACRKTNITFFVGWTDFDPRELTKRFDIQPTKAWAKGECYQSKAGPLKRPWSQWCVESSKLTASTSTEKHALALLRILEPKKKAIQAFAKTTKARVGLSIWWESQSRHGGFTMRSETFRRLGSLCKEIDFHYVSSTEPEDESKPDGQR